MNRHHVTAPAVLWAIRYGLPRGTYASADALDLIVAHWENLPASERHTVRALMASLNPERPGPSARWNAATYKVNDPNTFIAATPAETYNVDSSAIIWATRYAVRNPDEDIANGGLDLILGQWAHLSANDQGVIVRDLYNYPVAIPATIQEKWDQVRSLTEQQYAI